MLKQQFANKIVGQEEAVQALIDMTEAYRAGFCAPDQPAGNALFLGPTGCGKTHVCETFAENLFGNRKACIRIDCAEYQHSHEIAKLVGSPAGYLGHRETPAYFTQARLDKYHTDALKLSLVIFDEIEKASDALWNLLLGILDNATLTLGTNEIVNFSKTIIVLTSNLGAREMANRGIGFVEVEEEQSQERLHKIAISAARSKFSPELMNRFQHIVTFKSLTKTDIEQVLDIELFAMAHRLTMANLDRALPCPFTIRVSPAAKRAILAEGYSKEYGARHLNRAITKLLIKPLAKIFNSNQIVPGDIIIIDYTDTFEFYIQPRPEIEKGP